MSTTATYRVPGMSCDHCRTAIASSVGALAGVDGVDVDLSAKVVHVRGAADPTAVVAAIDDAGYDAEPA